MGRIGGFLRIIRPVNSVMLGAAILVGVAMAGGANGPLLSLALVFLTGFTLTGAAMVINDYYDRDIDAVNEPGRPIPSGEVKPREAVAYSILLSAVGLAAAGLTSISALGVAALSWILMMTYSAWGKRMGFLGNLMVSTCIGLPFVYGGIVAGNVSTSLLFSALAFLSNTGREVTKGIVDTEGDSSRGVKTVAVVYGVDRACTGRLSILRRRRRSLYASTDPEHRERLVLALRRGDRRRPHLQRIHPSPRPQSRDEQEGQEPGLVLDAFWAPRLRGGDPVIKN